jgi:hypothetical protein
MRDARLRRIRRYKRRCIAIDVSRENVYKCTAEGKSLVNPDNAVPVRVGLRYRVDLRYRENERDNKALRCVARSAINGVHVNTVFAVRDFYQRSSQLERFAAFAIDCKYRALRSRTWT